MPYPSRIYKLAFADPGLADVHVSVRAMTVAQALDFDELRMTPAVDPKALREKTETLAQRLADVIVEWDIDDADGNPVPITQKGVLSLEDWVRSAIELGMVQAYQGEPGPLDRKDTAPIESSLPMTPLPEPGSASGAPAS